MIKKWNLSDKYADWLMMASMGISPLVFLGTASIISALIDREYSQIFVMITLCAYVFQIPLMNTRNFDPFKLTYSYSYPPIFKVAHSDTAPNYVYSSDDPLLDTDILSESRTSAFGGFLYIVGVMCLAEQNYVWAIPLTLIGLTMALQNSTFVRRWMHGRWWGVKGWHIDGLYALFELPGLVFNRISEKEKLAFVTCWPDNKQDAFGAAVCDRRPSMYLVGWRYVLPVSYDTAKNTEVRQQMEQQLFGRSIPLVELPQEVMPQPHPTRTIVTAMVLAVVGYYFLLGFLFRLGHPNNELLRMTLLLLSVICSWLTMLAYAHCLQVSGRRRLKAAAASWWA
ncbi:MAG: hypothetical protein ACYC1M_10760 [Armatimonadota bacterium]